MVEKGRSFSLPCFIIPFKLCAGKTETEQNSELVKEIQLQKRKYMFSCMVRKGCGFSLPCFIISLKHGAWKRERERKRESATRARVEREREKITDSRAWSSETPSHRPPSPETRFAYFPSWPCQQTHNYFNYLERLISKVCEFKGLIDGLI